MKASMKAHARHRAYVILIGIILLIVATVAAGMLMR